MHKLHINVWPIFIKCSIVTKLKKCYGTAYCLKIKKDKKQRTKINAKMTL